MKTITLLCLLLLPVIAMAQSYTLYYSDIETVNSDNSVTVTPTVAILGNDGAYCDPFEGYTGYEYPLVMLNGNAWQLGPKYAAVGGAGTNINFARTFPNVTLPANGSVVDLSYAGKIQGVCKISRGGGWVQPLEIPFYSGDFLDGSSPIAPPYSPCFVAGFLGSPSCPTPLPDIFTPYPLGWVGDDLASQQVAQTVQNPKITANPATNVVWWFNGQGPSPTTYPTSITLTSSAGAATEWAVGQADSKVTLSATSGAQISVSTTGTHFSSSVGDISITATVGGSPESPPALFTMTANRPKFISRSSKIDSPCSGSGVQGWDTLITYTLRDNFNNTMTGVPVNEAFAGSTVWPPPTSQGGTTDPTGIFRDDIFVCAEPGASPMPISPRQPETTTLVDNFGQTWCAGSSVSNLWGLACQGNQVQSGTMKRYLDHGDVTVP